MGFAEILSKRLGAKLVQLAANRFHSDSAFFVTTPKAPVETNEPHRVHSEVVLETYTMISQRQILRFAS